MPEKISSHLTSIREFPQKDLSLKAITVRPEMLQTRADIDPEWVRRYSLSMAAGAVFPPVVVFLIEGLLLLTDGFHRFFACQKAGLKTIPAVVREGSLAEAVLFGIEANLNAFNRGRPVDREDMWHAANKLLMTPEGRSWSVREAWRRSGLSQHILYSVRQDIDRLEGTAPPSKEEWEGRKEEARALLSSPETRGMSNKVIGERVGIGADTIMDLRRGVEFEAEKEVAMPPIHSPAKEFEPLELAAKAVVHWAGEVLRLEGATEEEEEFDVGELIQARRELGTATHALADHAPHILSLIDAHRRRRL